MVLVSSVHEIQAQARGRRKALLLSQQQVADLAGVSRKWLSDFERHATTAVELPLVLRVLEALQLDVDIAPGVRVASKEAARLEFEQWLAAFRKGERDQAP